MCSLGKGMYTLYIRCAVYTCTIEHTTLYVYYALNTHTDVYFPLYFALILGI